MFESKYSNFLTILLVIIIIVVVGLLGFLGYKIYREYGVSQDVETQIEKEVHFSTGGITQNTTNEVLENPFAGQQTNTENTTNNQSAVNNNNDGERKLINEYLNCFNEPNLEKLISLYNINELNKIYQNEAYTQEKIKNNFEKVFSREEEYEFIFGNVYKIENSEDLSVLGDSYKPEQNYLLELTKDYSVYVVEFDLMSNQHYLTRDDWEILIIKEENGNYSLAYSGFLNTL